jgi:amino acid adenylation domain-containing protein
MEMQAKRPQAARVDDEGRSADEEVFVFPLSLGQERIWFLSELAGTTSLFNLNTTVRVRSAVDLAALERALAQLARRHESLRTRFRIVEGRPVQAVLPRATLSLRIVELPGREAEARATLADDAGRPFDLAQDELVRTTFVRTAPEDGLLSVTMHHIVSDGWSIGIFFSELSTLWSGFARGRPPDLPGLPIQYGDFAVWERERSASGGLEGQIAFWKKKLADAPAFEVPADHPRPAEQTFAGSSVPFAIEPSLRSSVLELGRRHGTTPFMTLFAAFLALLHRVTGEDDLVVGSYVAGRGRRELEGLIGFFLNTLPVRMDLSGDPSFAELLGRVRATLLEAFEHQEVPFARLVEELRPDRDLSRSPICQIVFQMINVPTLDESDEQREALVDLGRASSAFDLTWTVWDSGDGWRGHIEFCTDLFEAVSIERYAARYRTLLEAVVRDPRTPVSRLELLPSSERRLLLETWNDTARAYPETTLPELFAAAAARTPDAPAFVCGDEALSYAELDRRSTRLARHLVRLGAAPEELVAVCLERSLDACVAVLAVIRTGAAYLPLDPAYPAERLAFMLRDAAPVLLVTRGGAADGVDVGATRVVRLDSDAAEISSEPATPLQPTAGPGSLAYVIYTSGSTGRPKGVAVEQRQILNRLAWMWERYPFAANEVLCQKTALSFVDSIWELLGGLLQNVPTVVVGDEEVRDADALVDELSRRRVTRLWVVPSFLRALLDAREDLGRALPSLRFWVTSGEPLSADLERRFQRALPGATLHNVYGTSEVWDATWFDPGLSEGTYVRPPIGRPIANVRTYVLDRHGEPAPIGAYGELHVGGVGVARGPLGAPDDSRFSPDRFAPLSGGTLYATGDTARYLWEGTLELVGRHDDQLKIRGHRVEPAEIEAALDNHPAVRESVVVGRAEEGEVVSLVAYLVPAAEGSVDVDRLRLDLRARLPDFMVPTGFVLLDGLPRTPSGKRDRRRLPEIAPRVPRAARYERPTGHLERVLSAIWEELLGLEDVGRHDNFFDLGGHSLLLFQLQRRLQQALDVRVGITELFYHPTIEALAACCARQLAAVGEAEKSEAMAASTGADLL